MKKIILLLFFIWFGSISFVEAGEDHHHDHHHDEHHHDHHHEHVAPHGGTLVVLGGKSAHFAHLEFVLDPDSGKLTAYSLDGEAEKAVRLSQPSIEVLIIAPGARGKVTLNAVSNILTGESVGNSSEFSAVSPLLIGHERFKITIANIDIKGQTFKNVSFAFPEGNE